jgi:hypothetical protein
MDTVSEAARAGAPEANRDRRLREAMNELDAALGHLDVAFAILLEVRAVGAVPDMIFGASKIVMTADSLLLRRLLRPAQEAPRG